MALIRMCGVPHCSQRLSQPILWIVAVCAAYWTHSTAVCLLMVGLACLWLPTPPATPHPPPPPLPPRHSCHPRHPPPALIHAICDITVA